VKNAEEERNELQLKENAVSGFNSVRARRALTDGGVEFLEISLQQAQVPVLLPT
jgi:hypothetical protein